MGLFNFLKTLSAGSISATADSNISLYWAQKELDRDAEEEKIIERVLNERAFAGMMAGNPNVKLFSSTRELLSNTNNSLTVLIFYILMVESDGYRKAMGNNPELFVKDLFNCVSKKLQYKRENLNEALMNCRYIASMFNLATGNF